MQALNALDVNIPVWLAWVAIVLFVVTFTPIGFVGFLASGLWISSVSILLWRLEERAALASI